MLIDLGDEDSGGLEESVVVKERERWNGEEIVRHRNRKTGRWMKETLLTDPQNVKKFFAKN